MTAPVAHKMHRYRADGMEHAGCTCGWAARGYTSATVSLALAAHRNANGLNPRLAVSS